MSTGWRITCSFFLLICMYSCGSTGNDRKTSLEEVLRNQPFAHITDSIRQSPENALLYQQRADMLTQQNLHAYAALDYQKAWQLHPDEATALAYTSSLFLSGKEEAAMELLQKCAGTFPANDEFTRRLSEAYVQRGEIKRALDQYNRALEADPANFDACYQKGVLLVQLKDTAAAIEAFENAYRLQPLQLYGLSLADLYAETRNEKTIPLCDALIGDSLQRTTDALFIKGLYYRNTHRYNHALQQYDACIRLDWKFTDAYIEKGIILFNQQNIDEALNTFAVAAKVSVTHAEAYYWMGRCYEKIGQAKEARESYKRATTLNRDYPEAEEALRKISY